MTEKKIIASLRRNGLLKISQKFAANHGVTLEEMWSWSKELACVLARYDFFVAVHTPFGEWSMPRLARVTGCDHTTIVEAKKAWLRREQPRLAKADLPPTEKVA